MTHAQEQLAEIFAGRVPTGGAFQPDLPVAICDIHNPRIAKALVSEKVKAKCCCMPNCKSKCTSVGDMAKPVTTIAPPTFDLSKVKARVGRDNPTLTEDILTAGEESYRRYLMSCKQEPTNGNRPDLLQDEFWHAHVLHTEQYMADCEGYFGYYLHHDPL